MNPHAQGQTAKRLERNIQALRVLRDRIRVSPAEKQRMKQMLLDAIRTDGLVVCLDIETAPNLSYTWGKYEQNVVAFERETYMLGIAWKELGKPVKSAMLCDFPTFRRDRFNDFELVKKMWDILDEADVVVAHNGEAFDVKMMNARFIAYGLNPPSPYKVIDTKKAAKSVARFNSNKLDDLGQTLGVGRKVKHEGFGLWLACMEGKRQAWATMRRYNEQDVVLLEQIYLRFRPWMRHPNLNLYDEQEGACPRCRSTKLQRRGSAYGARSKRQRYQCQDCGGWSAGKIERTPVTIH